MFETFVAWLAIALAVEVCRYRERLRVGDIVCGEGYPPRVITKADFEGAWKVWVKDMDNLFPMRSFYGWERNYTVVRRMSREEMLVSNIEELREHALLCERRGS